MSAPQYNENVKALNLPAIERNAVWLAPSFTHRFDFSDDTQFDAWAKLAFKGAQAIAKEAESLLAVAKSKDAEKQKELNRQAQEEAERNPPKPAAEPVPSPADNATDSARTPI